MGLLNIFKKDNHIKHISVSDDYIEFDDKRIIFPASLDDIINVLGSSYKVFQNEHSVAYIFDNEGIIFLTCDDKNVYLKDRKAFIDQQHNIVYVKVYGGNQVTKIFHEECLPKQTCKASIMFNQKSISQYFRVFDKQKIGVFSTTTFKEGQDSIVKSNDVLNGNIALSFDPPRPQRETNYKIKPCNEEVLEFDNLNFKLCVLQVLIYDLELLTPYFNIDEFADWYIGKKIDTESSTPIKPALNYFKKLPIPKRLAEHVTEICMDGGNDIYMNIAPQWNGEDGIFDLNEISEKELSQFPHLKKITLMTSQYDKLSVLLENKGIVVEHI